MPIITASPSAQEAAPSRGQMLSAVKSTVLSRINGLYVSMLVVYNDLMDIVWHNPTFTPQEILDAFGTDATELFRLAGILKTAINSVVAGTIPDVPLPVTFNPDGTVTVNAPEAPSGQ